MPREYIPVLIFAALAAGFPAVTLLLFRFIRPTPAAVGAKLKPYECGVPAEGDTRGRYSVRFYIVAILFVIFDVETIFLFPPTAGLCSGEHVRLPGDTDHWVCVAVPKGRSRMGVSGKPKLT